MRIAFRLLLIGAALLAGADAGGQTMPSTAASSPASAPTTRRAIVVPPGFTRISESGREAICLLDDEPWVRAALASAPPTTRPSTMPIDLLERAQQHRAAIVGQIQQDLGFEDATIINEMFDQKLLPMLRQFDELAPPIIYMPTSRRKLRDLLRDGWEDPRFYYNRAADDVQFRMSVNLTIDQNADDTLLPALYEPADEPERRKQILIDTVRTSEAEVISAMSDRSQFLTQMAFVALVSEQAMNPLKLTPEQAWFGLGTSGFLSAKYASPILGMPREELVAAMTFEHPRNPVKAAPVDLLHPTPASELRERYVALYLDAMRRKSIAAVAEWTKQAGEDAIGKTLAAMRAAPPSDGAALVELIKQTTGADLTAALSPR